MEMEQWDDGNENENDNSSYQQNNNANTIDSYGDNSHQYNNDQYNDDQYNDDQYNDNDYDNRNYNNNNNNNNNNSNRYISRNNHDNYRANNYHRNNQYNQYNQYDNNYRGRGGYNKNRYNNNRYGGGYNNNYNYRSRGRGRGRERGRGGRRGRGGYNNRHRNNYNDNSYYQQKRSQYQPRRQYEAKNMNENNVNNVNNVNNMNNDTSPNIDEISSANPSSSSSSRPLSRDNRFGGRKKKKGRRVIEDDLDFDVNEEENDDNNQESNHNEQIGDYNDNNKRKTQYADDATAQLYETNRFSSNNYMNNNRNEMNNNQHSFSSRKMGQRRQNTLELENLSGRAKEMALQLKSGKYDCMVCQSFIGKKARIWSCDHCYTMFHITCINKWASAREEKDAQSEQRAAKPNYQITKIRCPACNFVDEKFKFNQYKCFCNKVIFDHEYRSSYNFGSSIPHSCGDICGKKRGPDCPHTCPAECHPGPCQPCKLPSTRKSSCPCGKLKYSLLCGQIEKQSRLCQQICNKLLKCGNHRCKDKCHHGECKQCEITSEQECFCGKHKKQQKCGTGIKVKIKLKKEQSEEKDKEIFVWKYSCNNKCNKKLSCNNHRCTLICHNGSCSNCPRKIEKPTRCACTKTIFKDVMRVSCMDKLPICDKKCGRMLGCGKHFCRKQCHDSKCQLCMLQVKKRCRCGASEKKFKCHDYQKKLKNYLDNNETAIFLGQQDSWIRCGKKCKRVKSCGKHICSEICCQGRTNRTYFEGHQCREICNKPLDCGRHRCSSYCHRGRCNPCGVTYRNGVECACGSVFVPGPFQCGTRDIPTCQQICNKILPDCNHLCASKCHQGPCPPCNRLSSRECPHGLMVHNLPCKIKHRSCGNPCGKILSCGIHKCVKSCHFGPCEDSNNNKKGCGQICGLKLKCGHLCSSKCHSGNCSASSCKQQINVKCKCGNTSEKQYCRGRTEYELKAVPCSENCQIAERNKRFAQALNIDITSPNSDNDINSEQKDSGKMRIPFAASTLKRILKWMNDDKSHTTIIKQNKKILSPKFVYYIEGIFAAYIADDSQDLNKFKLQYPDITSLISTKSDPIINLKPMSSEQRFIVYSLITQYHLRYEKKENSGKKGSSYLEISKTKHCRIPDQLLSNAIIEYQIRGNEIDTLETMPPSSIIVIDDSENISSSLIQDRLLAWTGDYRMWRNDNNQLFIVFTDQNARNSAMTEMRKFNGRKATQSDSFSASKSHKKNQQKKKKLKAQQQKDSQQKPRGSGNGNSGWSTKGDQLKFTVNNMAKLKPDIMSVKTNNRFG